MGELRLVIDGGDGESSPGPKRQARYRWAAEVVPGGQVLDAACGGGWGTALLGESAAAVGVDFSPPSIAAARRAYGERAEFVEGDLRELPFADGEFDSVVSFEAIAHVDDPAVVVGELHRVLRPGGMLLISAPNRRVYPSGNPLHLSEIDSAELEGLLRRRFASVAIHRQQTYFASLLCDEATLAHSDPATPIAPRTIKLSGGPPGSELHAVAVGTDGKLPPAPAWLAVGGDVGYAEQRRELEEWRQRAVRAEAAAEALRRELRDARQS